MKLIYTLIFLLILPSFAQVNVITTIKPLADIVKEIGKERVSVDYLIPSNVNFHLYEYKPQDMKKVYKADIFIFIGSGEPNVDSIVKSLPKDNVLKVIDIKGMYLIKEEDHDEVHPAVWLDPENAKVIAKEVSFLLSKKDPKNREFYQKNAQNFIKQCDEVLNYGKSKLSTLKNKYFVSYHYEFPYFINRFGLVYLAEIEIGHGREPTPKHILDVIQKMKKYNVKTVFTSKQFYNPKTVKVVLDQVGGKVVFLDTMGEKTSYIEMMRFNIDQVYNGLATQ
ncbi:metal ABC transporter substrate-binding protein [Sulfurihydrogenibium subterraneum]|uniref:metal ABC transporter substrate-binding protein n=1 Tax=Sulfurihydrogenibium subterraneum TaxID=171121 RepID=UPI00048E7ACD|nr:metal ABC transporter substrate-binding protein [Sulfurihydrogenibium subterraneum]